MIDYIIQHRELPDDKITWNAMQSVYLMADELYKGTLLAVHGMVLNTKRRGSPDDYGQGGTAPPSA